MRKRVFNEAFTIRGATVWIGVCLATCFAAGCILDLAEVAPTDGMGGAGGANGMSGSSSSTIDSASSGGPFDAGGFECKIAQLADPPANGIITNPSFEKSAYDDWNGENSNALSIYDVDAPNGNRVDIVASTTSDITTAGLCSDTKDVASGLTYEARAWVRSRSNPGATLTLSFEYAPGMAIIEQVELSQCFTQIYVKHEVPLAEAGTSPVRVCILMDTKAYGHSFEVDMAELVPVP